MELTVLKPINEILAKDGKVVINESLENLLQIVSDYFNGLYDG